MKRRIDQYSGIYKKIPFAWTSVGEYAILSATVHGKPYEKKVFQVTAIPIEEDMIQMISEMEIDSMLDEIQNEEQMDRLMERLR